MYVGMCVAMYILAQINWLNIFASWKAYFVQIITQVLQKYDTRSDHIIITSNGEPQHTLGSYINQLRAMMIICHMQVLFDMFSQSHSYHKLAPDRTLPSKA